MDVTDVILELTTNPEYDQNVSEILQTYFKEHPDMLAEWISWLTEGRE